MDLVDFSVIFMVNLDYRYSWERVRRQVIVKELCSNGISSNYLSLANLLDMGKVEFQSHEIAKSCIKERSLILSVWTCTYT